MPEPAEPWLRIGAVGRVQLRCVEFAGGGQGAMTEDHGTQADPMGAAIRTLSTPSAPVEEQRGACASLRGFPPDHVHQRLSEAAEASRQTSRPGSFRLLQELAAEVALAASRIERKRVSEREAREAEAQGQVNRALDALLAEGSSEAARAEALRLLKATPGRMLMDKTREILAALDGPWSSIPPERAEARALLGRFLEENGGVFGFPVEPYLPRVPHRVSVRGESTVGRLKPSYGLGLYDFHREWPIDGMGVPKDQIDVVLSDGSRQPILDWLRGQRVRVICPRCGGFVDRTVEEGCPGVVVRTAPGRRVSPLGDG